MGLVTPVEPVPVGELGRVHFVAHRRRRDVRHRPDHARPRRARSPAATRRRRPPRRARRGSAPASDVGHCGRATSAVGGHPGRLDRDPAGQPRARRGAPARAAGAAPGRRAGRVMLGQAGIAVAGTHGKTTTTSMITTVLRRCGADPAYVHRRDPGRDRPRRGRGQRARRSWPRPTRATGRSCCSRPTRRSSPTSRPTTSTTTAGRARSRPRSSAFAGRIAPGGLLVTCADDPGAASCRRGAASAGRRAGCARVTYGGPAGADYRLTA